MSEINWAEIRAALEGKKPTIIDSVTDVASDIFTRRQIRKAMRNLGIEQTLDNFLESNQQFKTAWLEAQDIELNEPETMQAIEAMHVDVNAIIEAIGNL